MALQKVAGSSASFWAPSEKPRTASAAMSAREVASLMAIVVSRTTLGWTVSVSRRCRRRRGSFGLAVSVTGTSETTPGVR